MVILVNFAHAWKCQFPTLFGDDWFLWVLFQKKLEINWFINENMATTCTLKHLSCQLSSGTWRSVWSILTWVAFFFFFSFFFIQWMYGMFCFFSFLFPFCIIKYVFLSCRCLPERKTSIENDITKDLLSGNEWGGAPWYPRLLADNTLQKGEFGTFLWWYIYIFWWIGIIFTILFA